MRAPQEELGQDRLGTSDMQGPRSHEASKHSEPGRPAGVHSGSPCCDLSDLLSNLLAPVGDEEGHPPCRLALPEPAQFTLGPWLCPGCPTLPWAPIAHRHGVLQLLFHLLEAGNEEASTGPPEQALQGSGLVGLHGTCHKAAGQGWRGAWTPQPMPPSATQSGHPHRDRARDRQPSGARLQGAVKGLQRAVGDETALGKGQPIHWVGQEGTRGPTHLTFRS